MGSGREDRSWLVLSDMEEHVNVLQKYLDEQNIHHINVQNHRSAMVQLVKHVEKKQPIQGIIIDSQLGSMPAREFIVVLSKTKSLAGLSIILMGPDSHVLPKEGGLSWIPLSLPFTSGELAKCLENGFTQKEPINSEAIKILVVEDSPTNQKVVTACLDRIGCQVSAAFDGLEAIQILSQQRFDAVLMDIQMPKMDGIVATRIIRKESTHVKQHSIPIIGLSAKKGTGDREVCLSAGMTDYLTKPVNPFVLHETLHRILRNVNRHMGLVPPAHKGTQPVDETDANNTFDVGRLIQKFDGDEVTVHRLLRAYLDEAPKRIDAIKTGIQIDSARDIQEQGHALKGASANLYMSTMSSLAFKIELAGKEGSVAKAKSVFPMIIEEFHKVQEMGVTVLS